MASGLQVSDISQGWSFVDGQTIKVSMGPNKVFIPYSRINILQCADPGGTKGNLPTKLADCDENTIQGDSVIVQPNGSFSETAYVIFGLPSAKLGEGKAWQPVCDISHQCVLYVGENQNDFTKPKVFSHPFTVHETGSASS